MCYHIATSTSDTIGMMTDNSAHQSITPQVSLQDDTKNGSHGSLSGLHDMGQLEASSRPRQGEKVYETSHVSAVEAPHSNSKATPEPEPEPAASTGKYCAQHIPKESAPETAVGTRIEMLQQNECFEEIDGQYECTGTLAVYRFGDDIFHMFSKSRYQDPTDIRIEESVATIKIPLSAYCPLFKSIFNICPDALFSDCYVKRPSLISYDRIRDSTNPRQISDDVLAEVEICELLKQHPHPNIACYLGCQVREGRITGICFAKYQKTLMRAVNPGSHMKRRFRYDNGALEDVENCLKGVEEGIRHLHSLGLVHNDINPANIMFEENGIPVIIDFGSCRAIGQSLEGVGRTYEWYDRNVKQSIPNNDWHALQEIREWLSGSDNRVFRFRE